MSLFRTMEHASRGFHTREVSYAARQSTVKMTEQPVGEGGTSVVRLFDTLHPGNVDEDTANAKSLINDDDEPENYIITTDTLPVTDPDFKNFGLAGEQFRVRRHPDMKSRFECIGSQGLIRRGKTYGEITEGNSGEVDIWRYEWEIDAGTLVDSGVNVTAHNTWGAGDLEAGTEVWVFYMIDSHRWIAVSATSVALWRFTLNANMSGNQAAADKLQMDGTDTNDDIVVKDLDGNFSRALIDAKGICAQVGESYYVLECQSKAGWIEFTLTANLGSSASCSQQDFGGTQQDVQDPTATTVHDPQGLFEAAVIGCQGRAHYDAIDDQYNVVECQTIAGWIEFTLSADLGSSAVCTLDDYGGSQQDIFAPGAIGLVVHDAQGLFPAAVSGCKGRADYDAIENHYDVVECQTIAGWIEFTLTADLGASAAATIQDWGGTQNDVYEPASPTTVHDAHGLFTSAVIGCKGRAEYDAIENHYDVVECQTIAGWIRFTLTEDMGVVTALASENATVEEYGGSQNDVVDPDSIEVGVDVWDEAGNFPNALEEAKGEAIWDSTESRYRVISCNQQALRLQALVKEEGTPSGVATDDEDFQVDTLVVASPVPFGQLPSVYVDTDTELTVLNRYKFRLDDNAEVDIYYTGGAWVCVQGTCPTP